MKVKWADDEEVYLIGLDGTRHFIEEYALSVLLREQVLMMSYGDREICELMVVCNDLFYWGTADCEPLPYQDLEELYKAYKSKDIYAVSKWCCFKRNLQPQVSVIEKMKEEGSWTEEMEQLEKNDVII